MLVDRDLPGLPARLAMIAAELKVIAGRYPTWGLPATAIGDAIEQAQLVRELAHTLTAVLACEVTTRDLAADQGLSRTDFLTAHAPTLEGTGSAAVATVGAALTEPRWADLARLVRSGQVPVDTAALIIRFHRDVHTVADPAHLTEITTGLVHAARDLTVTEMRRAIRHARTALRPPALQDDEDARLRAGRSLTKTGRCAGLTEYRLRLDPEGAAILDAAIDPLARPRPDLPHPTSRRSGDTDRSGGGAGT